MHVDGFAAHRSIFLRAYYYGTWPVRAWRNRAALAAGRAPVPVLFYHRIADDTANSWTLSNDDFERQIEWLGRHFDIVSLNDVQRRMAGYADPARRLAVCITFDDGHADNCHRAIPFLVKKRVPCTYFVSVQHVVSGEPFASDGCAPNTVDQIRAMADAGIEIGAHTATHADLGAIRDRKELRRELVDATRQLEDLIQRRVRYFAFPYGQYVNLTSEAFQMARDAGFEGVCSAYGGYNCLGDDPFHIQRFHADPGMIRVKNRATIDPRMTRTTRYRPTPIEAPSHAPTSCDIH